MNNFQKLAAEQGLEDRPPPKHVQNNITATLGIIQLLSNLVDLFLPRFINTFADMAGSKPPHNYSPVDFTGFEKDNKPPKYPNRPDQMK